MPTSPARPAWLIALVVPALLLAGCASSEPENDGPTHEAQEKGLTEGVDLAPVSVELSVEDPRGLFRDGSRVTLTAASASDTDRLIAGVVLDQDVEVISGNLSYDGPVEDEEPITRSAVIRAEASGEHVLRAWAERPTFSLESGDGSRAAAEDLVGIRGDRNQAERFHPAPRTSIPVDLKAADEGRTWHVHVATPTTTTARLFLYVPEPPNGIRVVEGETFWEGALQEDAPETFRYEVAYPEDGTFLVQASVHPAPWVSTEIFWDAIEVTVEGDQVTVEDAGPRR